MVSALVCLCYHGVTLGATTMVLPLVSYGSDTLGVTMMVSPLVSLWDSQLVSL